MARTEKNNVPAQLIVANKELLKELLVLLKEQRHDEELLLEVDCQRFAHTEGVQKELQGLEEGYEAITKHEEVTSRAGRSDGDSHGHGKARENA